MDTFDVEDAVLYVSQASLGSSWWYSDASTSMLNLITYFLKIMQAEH